MKSGTEIGHPHRVPWILIRCPRVDSNHHASRHRPSTCCVYHSATRANHIISHGILYQTLLLVNPHRVRIAHLARTTEVLRAVNIGFPSLPVPVVSRMRNVMGPLRPERSRISTTRTTHVTCSPIRKRRV